MTPAKLIVVAAFGLSAAACSYSSTTTTAAVPGPYRSGAEQACVDYGFQPGTDSYNRCVSREAQSRAAGRVPADYAAARLAGDARDACYSYGLTIGSAPYDRCVNREIEARRYSQQAVVTSAPGTYYPSTTVYTTTPGYAPAPVVYAPAPVTYAPAAPTPPAGVQAFRDEFGFRYDGQGNRIDAQGNIISPQSTRP
ncbi:MAG TPA: hypothetical protein VGO42_19405 [Reyranella sp.]|nr:hypothetical protein [Reyranella sp.]